MVVLAYLGSQCTKFHAGGWMSFYLWSYIWTDAISRWLRQRNRIKFVQISEKMRRRPWQCLEKRSRKKAWALWGNFKLIEAGKGETGNQQSQEHAHHFLWHQRDCSQRFRPGRPNSQCRLLLWLLRGLRKSVRRLLPELWMHMKRLLQHDNVPSHTSTKNNMM
jgi:hypothetical protein